MTQTIQFLVKATLTLLFGLSALAVARKSAASARHALLLALFLAMALLPVVSAFAPSWTVAIRQPAAARSAPTFTQFAAGTAAPRPRVAAPTNAPPNDSSPMTLLFAIWLTGMILFLTPVATGLHQVRSLRRSALPWREAACAVPPGVELLIHEGLAGPMTCGVFRPAIIMPLDAQRWTAADLDRAIVHELAHVHRYDWGTQCLARIISAAYWFHPLIWIAWRQLVLEAERSCDDAVLQHSDATAYADQLVGLARRLSACKSPLLAMANRADLSKRVTAVLDGSRRRRGTGRIAAIFACAAAIAIAALSPLRIVAAPQTDTTNPSRANLRVVTNLVQTPVTVTDENGRPIELLTAADFSLTEDGVPQTISVFEAQQAAYVLGYYPKNGNLDGSFRKITVTGKLPMMKLEYRSGYYANAIQPPNSAAMAASPGPPDVRPPALTRKYEPVYSDAGRRAKYQGSVRLSVRVDATGRVPDAKVIRAVGLGLDEVAIDAIKRWQFRPATKNGIPVDTVVEVEAIFRLL